MKNIKRALKSIALSSIISASLAAPTFASPKGLSRVTIDQVFTDSHGTWYPGKSQSSTIKITNNGSRTIILDKIYFNLTSSKYINNKKNSKLDKGIEDILLNSTVKITYGTKTIFNGSFKKLLNEDGFLIKDKNISIISKSFKILDIEIDMNGADNISNDAQFIQSIYSIKLDYRVDDSSGGGSSEETDKPTPPDEEKEENPNPPDNSDDEDRDDTEKPKPPDNQGDEDNDDTEKPKPPDNSDDSNNNDNKPDNGSNGSDIDNSKDKLPQTGGILNSTTLTILGLSVAGIGVALDKKSSSKKGGNKDE